MEQIAHKSLLAAKKSCDEILLRVQRDPLLNCSIDLYERIASDKCSSKPSTTELTTEPHSRKAHWQLSAAHNALEPSGTTRSSGLPSVSDPSSRTIDHSSVGSSPAFLPGAACTRVMRPAEFISVSGDCAARSAHFSDLRIHKRSSGGVAATEHLHAPMNSPTDPAFAKAIQRDSFSTSALKCIEGDSSWL